MAEIRPLPKRRRRRFAREVRALLDKSCDSLYLAIELYSRPQERGRNPTVVMLLAHACEMLLKAAMTLRGADIWQRSRQQTLSFRLCVDFAVTDSEQRFVEHTEGLVLRALVLVRNQEQHYLAEVTERALAVLLTWSVGVFGSILRREFQYDLSEVVPVRAVSDIVLQSGDIAALAMADVTDVRELIRGHSRSRSKGEAQIRPWAAINRALSEPTSAYDQDSSAIAETLGIAMRRETEAADVFEALGAAPIVHQGLRNDLVLRFSPDANVAVKLVSSTEQGTDPIPLSGAAKAEHWDQTPGQVAEQLDITNPKLRALGRFIGFDYENGDQYVDIIKGSVPITRYSDEAVARLKAALEQHDIDRVWAWSRGKLPKTDV